MLVLIGDDVIAGEAPGLDSTSADVARYVSQLSDTTHWIGHLVALVGVGALVLFFTRLSTQVRDTSWSPVVRGAGIAGAAVHVTAYATFGALLLGNTRDFDADVVRLAIYTGSALFVLAWIPFALALTAAAVGVLRGRTLPRWFGLVTLVQAIAFVAGLAALPATYAGYSAYPLFWLWLITASVVLARNRGEAPNTA